MFVYTTRRSSGVRFCGLVILTIAVIGLGVERARAGGETDFHIFGGEVATGDFFIRQTSIRNMSELPVNGWSLSVCHDPVDADLLDVVPTAQLLALTPDFSALTVLPGGYTAEVVLSPGEALLGGFSGLYVASYTATAPTGSTISFELCDDLTTPPVPATIVRGGVVITPTLDDGQVTVGEPAFRVTPPTIELGYVSGTVPQPFTARIEAVQLAPGPALPTAGFSFGVQHDPLVLQTLDVNPFGLLAMIGGAGPDFFGVTTQDDGWAVGVVYSFGAIFVYLDQPQNLIEASYQVLPTSGGVVSSPLEVVSTIGVPPVSTTFVVNGAQRLVERGSGSVRFTPLLFQRGDTNDDGGIDIADGVTVLEYLFSEGPTPGCLAAADINADSGLDIGDPIYVFNYLLLGGPPPTAPFFGCGADNPTLSCFLFESCP